MNCYNFLAFLTRLDSERRGYLQTHIGTIYLNHMEMFRTRKEGLSNPCYYFVVNQPTKTASSNLRLVIKT